MTKTLRLAIAAVLLSCAGVSSAELITVSFEPWSANTELPGVAYESYDSATVSMVYDSSAVPRCFTHTEDDPYEPHTFASCGVDDFIKSVVLEFDDLRIEFSDVTSSYDYDINRLVKNYDEEFIFGDIPRWLEHSNEDFSAILLVSSTGFDGEFGRHTEYTYGMGHGELFGWKEVGPLFRTRYS